MKRLSNKQAIKYISPPIIFLILILLSVSQSQAKPIKKYIPSLNAKVTELYFFESGYNYEDAPYKQRVYKTEFTKSNTRYVNWELNLKYPNPNKRIDFEIVAILYSPDGSKRKQTKNAYIKSNWSNSWHTRGWGNKKPGKFWSVGTYRVDLFIKDKKVASESFSITDDEAESSKLDKKPNEIKSDIPLDDLGEL